MKVNRPLLLAVSLVVAFAVSAIGGYVWSRTVADDGPGVDAELVDPQDRVIPDDPGLEPNEELQGDALPIVSISDRDGNDVSTESLLGGKPLVINFWFSTCGPCAKELPEFATAHAEFGDDVDFVGVNPSDPVPTMERFADERGITYELLSDDLGEFTEGIGASNFPVTIFVTSDGTIVEQTGVVDADDLREKITDLEAKEELV